MGPFRLFLLLTAAPLFGQTPLRFEVATIKPAIGPSVVRPFATGGGRFTAQGMNLKGLIYYAYGSGMSTALNVSGGPDWINKDRYDIQAQASGNPTDSQLRAMFRSLVEERFAVKLHHETRSVDVYALVVDGKLGPKIQPWNGTCADGRPPTDDTPTMPRCNTAMRSPGMVLDGVTMFAVAEMLTLPQTGVARIVQDRTGLTGRYKMELEFTFTRTPDPNGPSVFTAIKEQWGLKLEPAKGLLEAIIVDAAQPPTEN
ncbi:MAG: TIGR03435 family protein [Bryobacteraceae bacterium]